MTFNTLPVVPKKYSLPELLPKNYPYMYESYDEAIDMVKMALYDENDYGFQERIAFYDTSMTRILEEIE